MKVKLENVLKGLLDNPRTTATGIGALLALCGVAPAGHEEQIALLLTAIGVVISADAKRNNSGAGGSNK